MGARGQRYVAGAAVLSALVLLAGCTEDDNPAPAPQPEPSATPSGSETATEPEAPAFVLGGAHVLVPDPAGNGLLAVSGPPDGGTIDGSLELWRWTGSEWAEVSAPGGPSARSFFAAAFDDARGVLVVHGGDTAEGPSDETWEWDGQSWTRHDGSGPGPRLAAEVAFDPSRQAVVMYGGDNGSGEVRNDTWSWDGSDWTRLATEGPTPPRFPAAMVADPDSESLVLYGGHQVVDEDLPPAAGDTWVWDGSAWRLRRKAGGPGDKVNAGELLHPRLGPLLVGGSDNEEAADDIWRWTQDGWELLAEGVFPPRQAFGLAYDEARDVVVMTGGVVEPGETPRYQDVWEWSGDPDQPAVQVLDAPPV